MVITGLEQVVRDPNLLAGAGRLGLLYNQASVDSSFRLAPDVLNRALPGRLTTLFGPQHGAGGTEQDNMDETPHATHPRLGLPIFSLYAQTREPSQEMLELVDTVVVDLQDVGARVYTFAATVLHLMEACAGLEKALIVLDRPNPINGTHVEGNLLKKGCESFVGPRPIPMRHGLTLGELMKLYNEVYQVGCTLSVVAMENWDRRAYFEATGLPWALPSPNMPLVDTAIVYPGQVVLEGTNLSEGRGTTRPFEIFGAPYMKTDRIMEALEKEAVTGAVLREAEFRPTFNKWAGQVCRGFQIHVTDRDLFRPYRFTLALISALLKVHPGEFRWSDQPYEYVTDRLPADVILGDPEVRQALEAGRSVREIEESWEEDLRDFLRVRSEFLIY